MSPPDFSFEQKALKDNAETRVIGLDEAGRGPWAGPVMVAGVWINPDKIEALPLGLDDSKKLSRKKRRALYEDLNELAKAKDVILAEVLAIGAEDIDKMGILTAVFHGMDMTVVRLGAKAGVKLHLLVDGNLSPRFPILRQDKNLQISVEPIVKGDSKSLSIAAASIFAKETRDIFMEELSQTHGGYGWERNMGYGTKEHQEALAKQGLTAHHRLSFKPIAQLAAKVGYTR